MDNEGDIKIIYLFGITDEIFEEIIYNDPFNEK